MKRNVRLPLLIAVSIICAALICVTAYAIDGHESAMAEIELFSDAVTVDGVSGRAVYEPSSRTLTLDNFIYRGEGIYADVGGELNIRLVGSSVIESTSGQGIFARGELSVSADEGAELTVSAASGLGVGNSSVAIHANGKITLHSGKITALGGDGAEHSMGISSYSDVEIKEAYVEASGGVAYSFSSGIGISPTQIESPTQAQGSLTVSGGALVATAAEADSSVGVRAEGEISITGGEVRLCADRAVEAYSFDASGYFMPEILVGESAESAVVWQGELIYYYPYISVGRAVTVTAEPVERAQIIIGNRYAGVGECVEVCVIPDAGYKVSYISVTDALGNAIPISKGSFIMPVSAVTVSVSLEPLAAELPTVSVARSAIDVEYGYSSDSAALCVAASMAEGIDTAEYAFSYKWYEVTGDSEREIHGASSYEYLLPCGMDIGAYSYYCRVGAERRDNGLCSTVNSGVITVNVVKCRVEPPSPDAREFVYSGDVQRYELEASELYTVYNAEGLSAGEGSVRISLCDKDRYCWQDGSGGDLEYPFVIQRAVAVIALDVSEITLTYGDSFVLPLATSNIGEVQRDMNEEDITEVGIYAVKYAVLETNNYIGDTKTLLVTVLPRENDNVTDEDNGADTDTPAPPATDDEGENDDQSSEPDVAPDYPSPGVPSEEAPSDESGVQPEELITPWGGKYTVIIIIVGVALSLGIGIAVTVLIIIKAKRDAEWREYSEGKRRKRR